MHSAQNLAKALEELKTLLPQEIIHLDEATLEDFASDWTEDLVFRPEVGFKPVSTEQISTIFKVASKYGIPVTPRGAGTGLSGGALPVRGGFVVSCEKMNRILEIDQKNLVAVVQPGVVTEKFQNEVEAVGLFYPPDPASRGSCMLGGNVAECSGGPRAVKYGVTKDYILGVEAVLPSGEIIRHGGKLFKNVTGYNLTQLLVGSEGTLAFVTEITIRLIPFPKYRELMLVQFSTMEDAAKAVPAIFHKGIMPSACEFMEKDAIQASEKQLSTKLPCSDAEAILIIEVDGNDAGVVERERDMVCETVLECNATDVIAADTSEKQKDVWRIRRATGEAVKSLSVYKEEDTVVPRYELVHLAKGVKEIAKKFGIHTICYGHAGDGNLHVNILKMDLSDEDWKNMLPKAITEIFQLTVKLGGTLSGEHGIGYSQKEYMPIAFKKHEIELMKKVKAAFDPQGILNPDKIFPD